MNAQTGCVYVCYTVSLFFLIYASQALATQDERAPVYAGFNEIIPSKNHFLIVGDTQATSHWEFWRERNDKARKLIIDEISKRAPAFVLHLGDLTTHGSSKKQWQDFDDIHALVRKKNIPYFPILGNHEFYGNDEIALHYYFKHFPHLKHRRWYSFNWRNVGIIMVDSNFSTMTTEQLDMQNKWYLSELERFDGDDKVDYVIVCCHEPPFTNSHVVSPNLKSKKYFADPYTQSSKAILFFSGHSHTYERFEKAGKFFIVSGGGGGPRHKVITDPKKQLSKDIFSGPELRFFHFCQIKIEGKTLSYEVIRLETDGTFNVVDSLKLKS